MTTTTDPIIKHPDQAADLHDIQLALPAGTMTVALGALRDDELGGVHSWSEEIQHYEQKGWAVRQVIVLPDEFVPTAMVVFEAENDGSYTATDRIADQLVSINTALVQIRGNLA